MNQHPISGIGIHPSLKIFAIAILCILAIHSNVLAQIVTSESNLLAIKKSVPASNGAYPLFRICEDLTAKSGIQIACSPSIRDHILTIQFDRSTTYQILDSICELNEWIYEEQSDKSILIRRRRVLGVRDMASMTGMLQSATTTELKNFLRIGVLDLEVEKLEAQASIDESVKLIVVPSKLIMEQQRIDIEIQKKNIHTGEAWRKVQTLVSPKTYVCDLLGRVSAKLASNNTVTVVSLTESEQKLLRDVLCLNFINNIFQGGVFGKLLLEGIPPRELDFDNLDIWLADPFTLSIGKKIIDNNVGYSFEDIDSIRRKDR